MALTRITKGVIKPNENYDTHNINSTGIVTSVGLDVNGNADISGSLSVGGVLTYEDVTSIDSVGIITARTGLVSPYADIDDFVSVGSNIHLGNAGVVTATSFVGSGAALTGIDATSIKDSGGNVKIQAQASGAIHSGISTFSDDVTFTGANYNVVWDKSTNRLKFDADAQLRFQDSSFRIYHDGSGTSFIRNTSTNLRITSDIFRVRKNNDSTHYINCGSNRVQLYESGNEKLATTSTGVNVTGNVVATGADINGDLDVDGHTNLDNVSIAGVTTFSDDLTLTGASYNVLWDKSDNQLEFGDNAKLSFGGSSDMQLYHDSNNSYIDDSGNGSLFLQSSGTGIYFQVIGGSNRMADFNVGGDVKLYHNANSKLRTTNTGAQIDTILKLYGAAGTGGGKLQLAEGGATSEIGVERSTDTSSSLLFGTEISGTTATRAKIDTAGHFIPATDSTYDLGLTGTRWRNLYADTLYGDGSNLTGITGTTINNNADNRIITGSGTANTLNGEANILWDGATLKIGNTESPSNYNSASDNIMIGNHSGHGGITILSGTSSGGFIMFSDNNGGSANAYRGQIEYQHGGSDPDHMRFLTDSTEHLRIRSKGALMISGTDTSGSTDMKHGSESGGGDSNSIYIPRANSTFDWKGGMVMRGVGGTWGLRISAQGAMTTNSDTTGEIFGVHPVEPTNPTHAQSTVADAVTDAYFRVMGNAKIFATVPIYQSGAKPFYYNATAITSNETITTSYNAMCVGNMTINSGVTVTVNSGARWVIV